ncbi:N-formylglutamate amidohydrolase [Labrenzia sp. CP4]|mgnify:FL=1|jgi:formiminoglutamase|uniref:N-formylglutamate deformylase n=1 Tax=Stappiaceae TaxID=2821832 RepID=UPI0007851723|nr:MULTISPECIES: N-formylglutamate deformylase [Stappiaceae]AMN52055.1 N-formylglutamate amidohydrolase [Labrenzia sp. CP4]QFS98175.1 N-formylglutamate amidohydrolase [Labrenzia sp. THAF191b]QFT04489.1 N-formylglutamate amidohydrolase [Labrenzia sp. THAF191a]QFT16033.1 N-formylglutamate amidohydrolase [Labrenzia sp. THAF187b]UFI03319.1 N-formylglutamate deformylase [Roseibium aggregatum]
MQPVDVFRGDGPVVLGVPHAGTFVPDDIKARFNDTGLKLADTDWHVDRLYSDLLPGATMVKANFHRYVIDANRDPEGVSLYPGQNTTTLCPTTDFDGRPIYQSGMEPETGEIEARRLAWHAPYHAALQAEMERVRAKHGVAILYDCHSIRSVVPFLFEGTLPDFNTGTNNGTTCASAIEAAVVACTQAAEGYTSILNGRFKGGWTTRHYGRPAEGFHAIQMELAQKTHLATEDTPFAYDEAKADRLRTHLKDILSALENLAPSLFQNNTQGANND